MLGGARGERLGGSGDFWTGYRHTALRRDELLLRLDFPLPHRRRQARFRKVGTRRAQAISKVVMALA